jgi:hemerythrin
MQYLWVSSLETGIAEIDSQHKELFTAINNLLKNFDEKKTDEELKKSLDFLNNYTVKHFSYEEQIQKKYNYPDYENHKKLHEDFKKTARELSDELAAKGPSASLVNQVNMKIGNWLVKHIQGQDTKIAAHIKAVGK